MALKGMSLKTGKQARSVRGKSCLPCKTLQGSNESYSTTTERAFLSVYLTDSSVDQSTFSNQKDHETLVQESQCGAQALGWNVCLESNACLEHSTTDYTASYSSTDCSYDDGRSLKIGLLKW